MPSGSTSATSRYAGRIRASTRTCARSELAAVPDQRLQRRTFGGEWLFAVNDYIEGGVGLGYYQKTVHSIYADFEDSDAPRSIRI